MSQLLKKNIENLYPQFTVKEVLRQNVFKKTLLLKRNESYYLLRLFNLEGIKKEKVNSVIQILNKLSKKNCPHIVKFYEASHDVNYTYLGVISDYFDHQFSCPLSEKEILTLLVQITTVLKLFHPKRPHGKILLSNIFKNHDIAVLGEMNILFYLHEEEYQDIYLLAPEFAKNKIYDYKSDIWMLGLLIYQFMFKEPPFKANNINVLHKQILKGIKFTYNPQYSINMNNLLRLMLCYDPELRPTINTILNVCDQALLSQETIDVMKMLPKFKLDQIVLNKNRIQRNSPTVNNTIYLNNEESKQIGFRPSKVLKSFKKLLSPSFSQKKLTATQYDPLSIGLYDQEENNKSNEQLIQHSLLSQQISNKSQQSRVSILYQLKLPKVLKFHQSEIKQKNSPISIDEDLTEQPFAKYAQVPQKCQYSQKRFSPPKVLLQQEVVLRSFSQRQ